MTRSSTCAMCCPAPARTTTRAWSASRWSPAPAGWARRPWPYTRPTGSAASFPDGQLYVDLLGATPHPLPAADVLARFLRDLGVDGREIPVDDDERAARYRTVLAGRRMLVVLDNARDAAQVRPLLPGTASCAVLVTTRSRMPDLASTRLVDLNVLDDDEALTLFTRVVGDERAAAEPEATAELLLACAGLPLAIRICAARLATRSGWTIQAMANRLRDEHRRLDELRVGDLAVRASFQVSFASLPAEAQPDGIAPADAFRLLGLWQGPSISSAAAAALFGTPEYLAADALETLVDAHLLESTSPDRYKFHDLLRVYSSERAVADLSGPDRDAAIGRLLRWYMRTADAAATARLAAPLQHAAGPRRRRIRLRSASPSAEDALAWYDSERANLVAATRQASDVRPARDRLAAARSAVPRLQPPRQLGGLHRHAPHRAGQRPPGGQPSGRGVGAEQPRRGPREYRRQPKASATSSRRSPSGARSATGWARRRRRTTSPTPIVLGRTDEALDLYRRALDLNREVGHRYGEGIALVNLGMALLDLDRAEEAIDYLLQARRTFAEIEATWTARDTPCAASGAATCRWDATRTLWTCLRQALASHQAAGNRRRQAVTLRFLGTRRGRNGLAAEARESWAQAAGDLRRTR